MLIEHLLLLVAGLPLVSDAARTVPVPLIAPAYASMAAGLTDIVSNDNRTPAGLLRGEVLTLELRAAEGVLRPLGPTGPALRVAAFAEGDAPLAVPAPLIRVRTGTVIAARVRNDLPDTLRVHGLCTRGGAPCAALEIPAGETRIARFAASTAGTYHYWATTTGMPQAFRVADDSQLSGAFVVDATPAPGDDRVFVISEWTSLTRSQLEHIGAQDDPGAAFLKLRPDVLFLINGRAWPHTERLEYPLHADVRWRLVNLSTQAHPMHLHGFYFRVESTGDGWRETAIADDERFRAVTQLMAPGSTMTMAWTPARAGNWLFHCHVMTHVSPTLHVDGSPRADSAHGDHDRGGAGMIGMVLGITVTGSDGSPADAADGDVRPRKLTLTMATVPKLFGERPGYAFAMEEADAGHAGSASVPGPTLVLTRGVPVEITLVNELPQATAIHWHGMELDSYYDGVHGWSGAGRRVTPMIGPGERFVVRFTPPQTGTFMYHTHLHDREQLASGLYGAMLVVDPGERFDPASDHVFVIGRGGPARGAPVVINNEAKPQSIWRSGQRHRIRVINITPDDIFSVTLQSAEGPVEWLMLTKDGAPVPANRSQPGRAQQTIGVGETYDFVFDAPPGRRTLWLEVRSPGGRWHAQGQVILR